MVNAWKLVVKQRWIVLATDGRHFTLGRHSDPTEGDILAAEQALAVQGLSGWLAIIEGDYWARRGTPTLVMVRPLSEPAGAFEDAAGAFETARIRALQLSLSQPAAFRRGPATCQGLP